MNKYFCVMIAAWGLLLSDVLRSEELAPAPLKFRRISDSASITAITKIEVLRKEVDRRYFPILTLLIEGTVGVINTEAQFVPYVEHPRAINRFKKFDLGHPMTTFAELKFIEIVPRHGSPIRYSTLPGGAPLVGLLHRPFSIKVEIRGNRRLVVGENKYIELYVIHPGEHPQPYEKSFLKQKVRLDAEGAVLWDKPETKLYNGRE